MNCEPDGRNKFNCGKYWFKLVHSIVPAGHVTLSVPFDPVGPCTPVEPDTVLGPHNSAVWFVPAGPLAGVFNAVGAYDAVSTDNVALTGTLAVVANIEWLMFVIDTVAPPPWGK
jgi:hypothetical protein